MHLHVEHSVPLLPKQVQKSEVFQDWASRLGPEWRGRVNVIAADIWDGEIQALHVAVTPDGDPWPTKAILRSETVDILTVFTNGFERWVMFVEQFRPAAAAVVISNVAGGRKWTESPTKAAEREMTEELGIELSTVELVSLAPKPVLATPGITNECVHMFMATISVTGSTEAFLQEFKAKKTGVTEEGEEITLWPVPTDQARAFILRQSNPDAKTLLSLGLAGL